MRTAEGNIVASVSRELVADPAGSKNLGTYGIFMRENREIPRSPAREQPKWADAPCSQAGAGRWGKAEAVIPR